MKRLLTTGAFALALLAGAAAAQAVAPTPGGPTTAPAPTTTPGPTTMPTPQVTPSAQPSSYSTGSVDPQTAAACKKTQTTITDGITKFTAELDKANTAASEQDLVAAEEAVKAAGTELVDLSSDLKKDVEDVENPELATALTGVANELNNLGLGLDSLASLQNFDTERLQTFSTRVSEICGG